MQSSRAYRQSSCVSPSSSPTTHLTPPQTEIVQSNRNQAIETSRLKDQIIRSPEKLRTTIADLGVTLAKEQDSLRGFEAKERQMTTKITNLAKYEVVSPLFAARRTEAHSTTVQDIGGCIKVLDEWQVDVEKATEAENRYREHCDQFDTLQNEQLELENKISVRSFLQSASSAPDRSPLAAHQAKDQQRARRTEPVRREE